MLDFGLYTKIYALPTGSLKTFFSVFETPLTINFDASTSYVKAQVDGDLYTRTVLIRDLDNKVDGYAYYNWGSTQQFKAHLTAKIKYPTTVRPGGTTYNYVVRSKTYGPSTSSTDGFGGGSTFLKKVYDLYKSKGSYATYNESIDIRSLIASLVS